MSLHNGTAAETERKRMLEAEGHIILNLGQNQYGDLEDVCHDTIIEVKTSRHGRRILYSSFSGGVALIDPPVRDFFTGCCINSWPRGRIE